MSCFLPLQSSWETLKTFTRSLNFLKSTSTTGIYTMQEADFNFINIDTIINMIVSIIFIIPY